MIAAVLGAGAALVIPRIEAGRRRAAERDRARSARVSHRELERLRRDQRAHTGRLPGGARRGAVVAALERSITRDARLRVAAGTLRGPILRTTCRSYTASPGSAPARSEGEIGRYECIAVTADVPVGKGNRAGVIGYTFWARVYFRRSRYVWCKVNARPGEGSITEDLARTALPATCDHTRGPR